LAQCKKWTHDHIQKKEILNFDYDAKHSKKNKLNTKHLFVTTTRANKDARKVAKEY
jgi:restriction endonuclease Mrr